MKKNTLLLVAFSLFLSAQYTVATPDGEEEHHHTALEEEMERIGDAWKKVRRAIRNPDQFGAAAEQVAIMIEHSKKSIDMEPILLAEQEGEAAKKEFLDGYKKGMKATVALLEDLKVALEAGDQAAVAATVSKINDGRKKGHKAYKPEDEE